MSTFPPVADYAFLSNCEQSCLVAPDGSVEWLCLPRPDSPSVFGALLDRAAGALEATVGYWRDWLSAAKVPDHPWRPYLERSALTLKGLSYVPAGAIMAAATTSLPETPGGARNWDYRFTWIRDSAFMLRSLYELGFGWEAVEYFGFTASKVMCWVAASRGADLAGSGNRRASGELPAGVHPPGPDRGGVTAHRVRAGTGRQVRRMGSGGKHPGPSGIEIY
jgi:GH15 family glucan-1,4-alpha-glucosidase